MSCREITPAVFFLRFLLGADDVEILAVLDSFNLNFKRLSISFMRCSSEHGDFVKTNFGDWSRICERLNARHLKRDNCLAWELVQVKDLFSVNLLISISIIISIDTDLIS